MAHDNLADAVENVVNYATLTVYPLWRGSFIESVQMAYLAFTVRHSSKRSTILSYRDTRLAIAAP